MTEAEPPTPVLYVTGVRDPADLDPADLDPTDLDPADLDPTDLDPADLDPADLFDLAYLLRSPEHDLRGVCLTAPPDGADRLLDTLSVHARGDAPYLRGAEALARALAEAPAPLSLIVAGGYGAVADVLRRDRALFRAAVARLFLVGGYVNDYAGGAGERVPINPRVRELHPQRFDGALESRAAGEAAAFGSLLTSGEGVIWLPRDICLWRYAAAGALVDGGPIAEFLLRATARRPVLLSTPPAFLLARRPDPLAWMRLFRTVTARVEITECGAVSSFAMRTESPNLHAIIAIDGQALGKIVTARLRDRPLVVE